jgi:hypothetical protein
MLQSLQSQKPPKLTIPESVKLLSEEVGGL